MLLEGLFEITISQEAEPMDVAALSEDVKKALFRGNGPFDPARQDLFRFFVVPRLLGSQPASRKQLNRFEKKNSFSRVDHILIHTEPASPRIRLLGIFPTTTMSTGQVLFDFDGDAVLEMKAPGTKMTISGHIKNLVRNRIPQHRVIAARTDELAQWVFLRSYLETAEELSLQFLCTVPRDLHQDSRFLVCQARANQRGREITNRKRRVRLPSNT